MANNREENQKIPLSEFSKDIIKNTNQNTSSLFKERQGIRNFENCHEQFNKNIKENCLSFSEVGKIELNVFSNPLDKESSIFSQYELKAPTIEFLENKLSELYEQKIPNFLNNKEHFTDSIMKEKGVMNAVDIKLKKDSEKQNYQFPQ